MDSIKKAAITAGLVVGAMALPAHALTITPIFGSSINSDPNAGNIKNDINTAIAFYQSTFTDPITVSIAFNATHVAGGYLGQTEFSLATVSYSSFLTALTADKSGANDLTALAHLPAGPNNPVNATAGIWLKPANEAALGFGPASVNGGTINLNVAQPLVFGGTAGSGQYDAMRVIQHEIDEILGLGSILGLNFSNGTPMSRDGVAPEDLFRYDGSGARSFTTSSSATSYFSIDGTTNIVPFNQDSRGDYADWYSLTGCPGRVQDAFACSGQSASLKLSSFEVKALDVIGYNIAAVPEPESYAMLLAGLGILGFIGRRRSKQALA